MRMRRWGEEKMRSQVCGGGGYMTGGWELYVGEGGLWWAINILGLVDLLLNMLKKKKKKRKKIT